MEAVFTFIFWALNRPLSYSLDAVCPWDVSALPWDGICTHSPLSEGVYGQFDWTAEQLIEQAFAMQLHRADHYREWRRQVRASDVDGWLAYKRAERAAYVLRNPDQAKASEQKCKEKAVETLRHYCEICDHAFNRRPKLTQHLYGPMHAERVLLAAIGETKAYHCKFCNRGYTRRPEFIRHVSTDEHKLKVGRQLAGYTQPSLDTKTSTIIKNSADLKAAIQKNSAKIQTFADIKAFVPIKPPTIKPSTLKNVADIKAVMIKQSADLNSFSMDAIQSADSSSFKIAADFKTSAEMEIPVNLEMSADLEKPADLKQYKTYICEACKRVFPGQSLLAGHLKGKPHKREVDRQKSADFLAGFLGRKKN